QEPASADSLSENPAAKLASTSFDAAEQFVAEAFAPKEVAQPERTVEAAEKWAAAHAAHSATPAAAAPAEPEQVAPAKYFTYETEAAAGTTPKE
ncbi:MAG: hypothetical protein RR997_03315, partial [Raoultibacter sp.]